jgi:hypothetical protein
MSRLRSSLDGRYAGKNIRIFTPKNCSPVVLHFKTQKTCRVVGSIADKFQEMRSKEAAREDGMDVDTKDVKPQCVFIHLQLSHDSSISVGIVHPTYLLIHTACFGVLYAEARP